MPELRHQTIKLGRGKHHSPHHGACVMELASMLAGEPFSDRPHSVSPAIGAFLRRYNDLLDDRRRQDLYPYASKAVGTAAGGETEDKRVERLLSWADDRWLRRRWLARSRAMAAWQRRAHADHPEAAASYAIRAITRLSHESHAAALSLVDELIAIGAQRTVEVEPLTPEPGILAPDGPSDHGRPERGLALDRGRAG